MARVTLKTFKIRAKSRDAAADLLRRASLEVEVMAKGIAASGPYATGRLADSITAERPRASGFNVTATVGSDLSYANVAHDGADIHVIFPKRGSKVFRFGSRRRPQLRFFWRKAGRVVWMPHVPGSRARVGLSHPGMEGKKYLSTPLKIVGRKYRMRVVLHDIND